MNLCNLTDGGDGGHYFSQLELVQDGCLARRVQTHHKDPHFLLSEEITEDSTEGESHIARLETVGGLV